MERRGEGESVGGNGGGERRGEKYDVENECWEEGDMKIAEKIRRLKTNRRNDSETQQKRRLGMVVIISGCTVKSIISTHRRKRRINMSERKEKRKIWRKK